VSEANPIDRFVMCWLDLRIALCECDNNRFDDIIHALEIGDKCSSCDFFNLAIKDKKQQYRCRCMPSCIAATLHPNAVSYLNLKLGWIDEKEHLSNIGINT